MCVYVLGSEDLSVKSYPDENECNNVAPPRKSLVAHAIDKIDHLTILPRSLYLPPSWVQIEPTTKCNLRCTMCLRSHTCPDMSYDMSMEVFKLIIDQSAMRRHLKFLKESE